MWNDINYTRFLDKLYSYQDIKYKEFSKSLIPGNSEYEYIGVRIPKLKEIAKDISKTNYESFIILNRHKTFEEIMIHGLVIGYIKDIDEVIKLYKEYIPYIDNWSLCDSTVVNLKIIHKYPSKGLNLVKWCLNHKKTYYKRVGYVLLLNNYVKEEYLDYIFECCNNYMNDNYYVKMAVAWLVAECYIKYPDKTITYLKNNKLDNWTHNKSIQKIKESNRINNDIKEYINTFRRFD